MSERVKVVLQPFCGSAPCVNEDPDHDHGALLVRRVFVDGGEIPFTKAIIEMDAQGLLTVKVELVPGGIEVATTVDGR